MFRFGVKSLERMTGVDARLVEVAHLALELSTVDFGIPPFGGLRTSAEQAELFADKKSKADGFAKKSKHQTGKALDVFAVVDGKASWEERDLAIVAAAMLQAACQLGIKIQWGGLWKGFKDMPHFQIAD